MLSTLAQDIADRALDTISEQYRVNTGRVLDANTEAAIYDAVLEAVRAEDIAVTA